MRRAAILSLAFILCLALTWAGYGFGSATPHPDQEPVLKLDPRYRHLMALGFREVQADLLWMRAGIGFAEGRRGGRLDRAKLAELINQAVELDPYYYDAYWYGASLLPPKQAIALLKKGSERFPQDWKLPEMIGFNYHYYLRDYASAAHYYELAASRPGHPPYVPSLAGRFYCEADDIDSAIRVLRNFYDTCEQPEVKEDFRRRIEQLWNIKALREACAEFRRWSQRMPRSLEELVEAKILPELPQDPYGGHYYLTSKGRVACDTDRNHLQG